MITKERKLFELVSGFQEFEKICGGELHSIPIYVFNVNWLFQIFSFYYLCTSNKFKVWGLEFLINSFFHPMINLKIETKITF